MINIKYDEDREQRGLVMCDDSDCEALVAPVSSEDYQRAYAHWKDHSRFYGCSHGR